MSGLLLPIRSVQLGSLCRLWGFGLIVPCGVYVEYSRWYFRAWYCLLKLAGFSRGSGWLLSEDVAGLTAWSVLVAELGGLGAGFAVVVCDVNVEG